MNSYLAYKERDRCLQESYNQKLLILIDFRSGLNSYVFKILNANIINVVVAVAEEFFLFIIKIKFYIQINNSLLDFKLK